MQVHRATMLAAGLFSLACADTPTRPVGFAALDGAGPSHTRLTPTSERKLEVTGGGRHSCALTFAGHLRCWGDDNYGQAPLDLLNPAFDVAQVSAGYDHTCMLRIDGPVSCIGRNNFGQAPAVFVGGDDFVQLDAGADHTCALRSDGVIECWGGDPGSPWEYRDPVITAVVGSFVQVSAGDQTTCGLRTDGTIECGGVPGLADDDHLFNGPGKFVRMSAGKHFVCALRANHTTINCRGNNDRGQAPATITATFGRFTDLYVGESHGCAIRKDGGIQCWGTYPIIDEPVPPTPNPPQVGKFVALTLGQMHTCALRSDDQVECWGVNIYGQAHVPDYLWTYRFRGFFSTHLTAPAGEVSHVVLYSGGRNVNLRFSLGSDEDSFVASGYPKVAPVDCDSPQDLTTGTATTGVFSDDNTGNYSYLWSVPGTLMNSCHQFILKLEDGTYHRANFRFTGPPAFINQLGSVPEAVQTGTAVPELTLRVADEFGVGVAGAQMTFEVIEGGGSVQAASRKTDARGFLTMPAWTVGPPGPQLLYATAITSAEWGNFFLTLVTTSVP